MSVDTELSYGAGGHPAVLPGLNRPPGAIPILCFSEDTAFAERELLPLLAIGGFDVEFHETVPDQLAEIPRPPYALVLLAVTSSDAQGYDLCSRLCRFNLPLMLVLRSATRDEVLRGFEAGADGCMLAPFDPRELLVRLYALLRRHPHPHCA